MSSPADRRYATSHEWHQPQGNSVVIGISRYAVDELTDVTFVSLPKVGAGFRAGQSIGEVESVKATSEIYTGIDGTISEVNPAVIANPGLLNTDPFGQGWLVKLSPTTPGQIDKLLDAAAYDKMYPAK